MKKLKDIVTERHLDVRFWGFLDNHSKEIRELYETSRIFVLPSVSENFPIVLLEAMAAGMAIVTTRNTGCAEVVGDAALLVNTRDSESLAGALNHLIQSPDLCAVLGEAARGRLEENFSSRAVAIRHLKVFEDGNEFP
jgi:glycosyltransferase involved in cell wall biosynthesis